MKTIVKEKQEKEQEVKFPCLMRHPETETIILATGRSKSSYDGFVLDSGHSTTDEIGDNSTSWNKNFVPFDGSVTLSND